MAMTDPMMPPGALASPASNVLPFPPVAPDPAVMQAGRRTPTPTRSPNAKKQRAAATKAREAYARAHPYSISVSDDPSLASTIRQLFFDARRVKRTLLSQWNVNYQYLRNRPNFLPIQTRSTSLVPEIFPIISSKVGWKMDRRIINTVSSAAIAHTPYWVDTSDLAADLSTIMDATYSVNQEEGEIAKANWDAEIYGTGFIKTTWDPTLAGGMGDAVMRRVDPFTIYPDPAARSMEDINYIIEVRTMSLQEVDRRWPGTAKKLRTSPFLEQSDEAPDQLTNRSQIPRANPGAISPSTVPRYGMVGGGFLDATAEPGVTVMEAWLRGHDTISDPEAPYGHRVEETWRVVVVAGSFILMDEPATNLWSHGRHPYSRLVTADLGEFWGFSTVELLIPTQRSINRLLGAMEQNVLLTGNPTLVDDVRAGISRTSATSKPGQRFTVGSGSRVEWLKPPQMNQQMPDLVRYMLQRMEAVSGLAAVTRGGSAPGRNAQGVMDAMQEAAFVRIRMELTQLQLTLTDAGKLKASLIIENYTEPRNLAIIGDDGAKKMLQLQGRHFLIPTEDGEMPLEYTLLVDAGASEHTGRKTREDQLLSLANMGIIDGQAVLEGLDFPGRAEITKRMAAMQEKMMAMGVDPNKK